MMKWNYCIGIALCLALAGSVAADPPGEKPRWLHSHWWTRVCPSLGCCPDDYVRKPMPPICLARCGERDDYCRKPYPCLTDVSRCGGPDDYCRKSLPCLLCPPLTPYLQCHSFDHRCSVCGKRRCIKGK
jgi:hypothetical protein